MRILKSRFKESWKKLNNQIKEQKDDQEQVMTLKIKELLDEHHQLNKKYDFQLKDLCRSLTEQSEQMWNLTINCRKLKKKYPRVLLRDILEFF